MSDYFIGTKWSRENAKKALPVLVSFAESARPTTYTELARIILSDEKYAHPLMAALGRLGEALEKISAAKPRKFAKIPPIQLLVCNQGNRATGKSCPELPGLQ